VRVPCGVRSMDHELHLIVDMLAFAIDHHSPATVILIAGDRDYAYAMSTLRFRQYNVILIAPSSPNIPQSLKSQASLVIDWNYAILRRRQTSNTLPVWQPCRDIDEDIVERLVREIRGSNEDPSVTLTSSSHCTSTTATHARRVSAELLQPSVSQRNTDSTDAAQPAPTCTPMEAASIFQETPGVGSVESRARSVTVRSSHSDPHGDIQPAPTCTAHKAASISPETSGRSTVRSATPWAISTTQSTQAVPHITRDSVSLLTENNAPSAHTYAMNAVELRLNEGRASVDDIVTPPTNNISPPITQTSGTPVSRESLLALSAPDVDVIMSNVETGSPQATSVNNSSEHWALPVESVEMKIRRLTPPQFLPLINQLLLGRSKGILQPTRSIIRFALVKYGNDVYTRAGVDTFQDYTLLAEQASLIELGGQEPQAWISLHPSLFKEETNADAWKSRTTSSANSNRSTAPQHDTKASILPTATIPSPSIASQSTIRNRNAPTNNTSSSMTQTSVTLTSQESWLAPSVPDFDITIPRVGMPSPQATSVISDNRDNYPPMHQALPTESVEDKIRRLTPPQFLPLINQLLFARSKETMKPRRTIIAVALRQYDEDVYKLAGVNKFKDYTLLAQQASLIELGGLGGEAWIALHPNWFEEEKSVPELPTALIVHGNDSAPESPTALTVHSNNSTPESPTPLIVHSDNSTQESPTPSTVHSDNSSAPQDDIKASTLPTAAIPPPSAAPRSIIPNTHTPSLPAVSDKPIPLYLQPLRFWKMLRRVG
jgi:hypothetical protein